MSQDRRGFPNPGSRSVEGGNASHGSVRRARERVGAGLPLERPPPEDVPTSRYSPGKSTQGQDAGYSKRNAPAFPSHDQQDGIGAAISRPTPMPQWPLPGDGNDLNRGRSSPDRHFTPKGPPPQRPPRPSVVPSILDSSRVQDYTPSFPARQQPMPQDNSRQQTNPSSWENEDNLLSPDGMDPPLSAGASTTRSSMTTSSMGTIPDFPLPATQLPPPNPGPPRKHQNLGPPPAASRRGPSSYYSCGSFVSPIPEEFPEQLRKCDSFASSNAIPSSWGSADSDILGAYGDDYGEPNDSNRDEGPSLVREASLGKRGKPSLRTINKSQGDQPSQRQPNPDILDTKPSQENARYVVATGDARSGRANAPVDSEKDYTDLRRASFSSSSSSESDFDLEKPPIAVIKGENTRDGPSDFNLHRLEKRGIPQAMSDKIPGTKRPPRLDIDAVRDAESRGSLTSLSDLIRRATKLATNLDRDKTASRLGMLDKLNGSREFRKLDPNDPRASGSISDMLASFPPPGLSTPTGDQRGSAWPGPYDHTNPRSRDFHTPMSPGDSKGRRKRRRLCCGMSPWVFALMCMVVILLVTAAVVVPIVLIVLPRQAEAAAASASSNSTPQRFCDMNTPCLNGGVNISRPGSCGCVCIDGFGGETCATPGDGSCTTLNLKGTGKKYANATVGNAIPRLLEDSQANFSIPLDSAVILDLFNSEGISCTSENALVSFYGASWKRASIFLDPIQPANEHWESMETTAPIPAKSHPSRRHHQIVRRQQEDKNIATTNGIIFDPTATAGLPAPTKTSTKSPPSQSTSSSNSDSDSDSDSDSRKPDDSDQPIITQRIQDFARISVLFILEQTRKINAAAAAQEHIQSFFSKIDRDSKGGTEMLKQTMDLGGVEMPGSFVLDFVNFSILLEDGTLVGGKR